MDRSAHLGIDLGTTNTAAAVFDGERIELVRTTEGATLTPSVVRIDGRGRVTVGARARAFLDRDPENTRSEFKRLMGTGATLSFRAANGARRPEELAAEVLRSVRLDVREMLGFEPERAVLTVPALFELPQAGATSDAARLAGFTQIELLQEPVASALAAGWSSQDDAGGSWLVYDLGGGTFDVSLLETREGLLRVVGHDGDNFLGGRDIDLALVGWILDQLAIDGVAIDRSDPRHGPALRILRAAAEQAKIELTRSDETDIIVPELFEVDGDRVDVEITLDRATLELHTAPIIDRSISVCHRLLAQHGLQLGQIHKVVLVGGPTVIPFVRAQLAEELGAPFAEGLDPMSLVARGAALFAATAALDARPRPAEARAETRRVWLQYPAMTADLSPFVAGRLLEGPGPGISSGGPTPGISSGGPTPGISSGGPTPVELRLVRADGGFRSDWVRLGADGGLVVMVELAARKANTFQLEARDVAGGAVPVQPASIQIVHGVSIAEPPLSRSVGLALANDLVQVYLARGTPLPAKRTFVHRTVEAVGPDGDQAVTIPIVQGEVAQAHLCRLVGRLEIAGRTLSGPLPAGSEVEVTLEVDRGGRLSARALVPKLDQAFEAVAHLQIPEADPAALGDHLHALKVRVAEVRSRAGSDPRQVDRLFDVDWALQDATSALSTARGGDADAAQKARRLLVDAETVLGEVEESSAWPEIDERSVRVLAYASQWVSQLGTPQEQRMLAQTTAAVERARAAKNAADLERHLAVARQLRSAAYYRHPDAWRWDFETAASDTSRATDLPRAQQLVTEGRAAVAAGDRDKLRRIVQDLWRLLPDDPADRMAAHASGIR